MLNPIVTKEPVIKELRVDLKNGCRIKNQCNCDLKFNLKQNPKKEIIVGMDHKVDLSFQVINDGDEPAYGSKISFNFILVMCPSLQCSTSATYWGRGFDLYFFFHPLSYAVSL